MGWVTYQFSHAMRHNDANNMTPHHYHFLLWLPFPNFQINWCLSKNVSNVPDLKKGGLHLWTTTSFTYHCWLAFFSSFVKSWRKTTKLKKLFNWTADWSGELNTPDTQSTPIILLSANAVMQEILWTEEFFEFNQLQTQNAYTWASIFFSSNALWLSDKSKHTKHFKHHIFIVMCSLCTWFALKISNFC